MVQKNFDFKDIYFKTEIRFIFRILYNKTTKEIDIKAPRYALFNLKAF